MIAKKWYQGMARLAEWRTQR